MSAERGKATSSEQSSKSVTSLGNKEKIEREKIARGHARSKQWAAELSTGRMLLEQATVILIQQLVAAVANGLADLPPKLKMGNVSNQSKSCHTVVPAFTVAPRDPIFRWEWRAVDDLQAAAD